MGTKAKQRKKKTAARFRVQRAAQKCAEERERDAEKTTSTPSISPEDATAAKQTAEKQKLFVKGN